MNQIDSQKKARIYSDCRLHLPAAGIGGISSVFFLVLCLSVLSLPELQAAENRILGIDIVSETTKEVVLNVRYSYSGNYGNNASISVVMAENGKRSPYYGVNPSSIKTGHGTAQVTLGTNSSAPRLFTTAQLLAEMYDMGGDAFLKGMFTFHKTWAKPGAALTPVVSIVGGVKLLPVKPIQPRGPKTSAGTAPKRRILRNGNVELTYPDGTIKVLYDGGVDITQPDGTVRRLLAVSAQPPTPPSVPPDAQHADWLKAENEKLLNIITILVDHDQASINNFLQKEGSSASNYEKITFRSKAIEYMLRPHSMD